MRKTFIIDYKDKDNFDLCKDQTPLIFGARGFKVTLIVNQLSVLDHKHLLIVYSIGFDRALMQASLLSD